VGGEGITLAAASQMKKRSDTRSSNFIVFITVIGARHAAAAPKNKNQTLHHEPSPIFGQCASTA